MPASRTGRRLALATTLTGLLAAPLAVISTASPANAANVTVQILATNDFHGRLQLRGPENRDPDAGAAVLAGAVKKLEADNPTYKTVFAAAGDLIGASTFESFIAKDKPTIDALNEADLDVSAAGNHEFDGGVDDLVNRVMKPYDATTNPYGGAKWQYIAANVRNNSDNAHTIPDRWIEDFGSVQVGFVGAVTEDLPALVSPAGIASIKVTSIINEVNRSANKLEEEGADVIVLLVHEGAPDTSYASATSNDNAFGRIVNGVNPNIDAIVSGHTHLAYNHSVPVPAWEGRAVTERPVVSAGQYGQNLNQILFTVNDVTGAVTAKTQKVIELTTDADGSGPALPQPNFPADPATATIVQNAFDAAVGPGSVVLGQLAAPFKRAATSTGTENRGGESTLGNLVAEVQRWATASDQLGGAQIALMNAGGLRQNMTGTGSTYPADLTYKQAAVVQPFANTLVNMRLTGAQLKAVLEQQWQRDSSGNVPTRPFQRLGTSKGFRYTYDPARPEGDRITGMWLNGTRLANATSYSVTVNSFLASGGDNFRALRNGTQRRDTGKVDLQAMVDYMAANSPVAPDYTQHAVGVSFPAGAPADYLAGDRVKFTMSSLALSQPEDVKDASVKVTMGGADLGTFPVDNTLGTDQLDEYGKAAVDVAIPAGTPAGARELVVTGTTTGTVVTVPVTVRASGTTPTPPVAGQAETTIGKVTVKPKRVIAGETRARVKFRVRSDAGTPDGRVRVRVNGKVYKVRLEDGRIKVKLAKFTKPGRYKIKIKYIGTAEFESAKKVVKLRVRRG